MLRIPPNLGLRPLLIADQGIQLIPGRQESPRRVKAEAAVALNPALLANLETRKNKRESTKTGVIALIGCV